MIQPLCVSSLHFIIKKTKPLMFVFDKACFMFNFTNAGNFQMDPIPLYSTLFRNTNVPLGNCYFPMKVLSFFGHDKPPPRFEQYK